MKLLSRILLSAYCFPFALYSMDKAPDQTAITPECVSLISHTYNATYPKIKDFDKKKPECRRDLITIIKETQTLRSQGVSEDALGRFALGQKEPLIDHLMNFMDHLSPFDDVFNKGHLYLCVFFERLRQYNNNIKKNELSSPTWEEYTAYKNNKRIEKTAKKAAEFHLYIDLDKIYATSNRFMPIENGDKLATKEFEQLLKDVQTIRNHKSTYIEALALLLYDRHK